MSDGEEYVRKVKLLVYMRKWAKAGLKLKQSLLVPY